MLMSIFMDKVLSTAMSMSILILGGVLLFFAYRSKGDGKELIKKSIEKRNLFAEIILLFMGVIEGVNAATYAVKEGRDFGASVAMHVLGGLMSGVFAFGIYKQVIEVVISIRDNRHPVIIFKEVIDVLGVIVLAVLFPIVNSYFVAIAAHSPQDFWNTLLLDWGRIRNASVFYSTVLGEAHVFACFLLSLNSFDTSILDSNGGTDSPLAQASESEEEKDAEEEEVNLITDVIPVKFDPSKVDIENYLVENFPEVDKQRLHHRLLVDPKFKKDISNLVVECLTFREEWDNQKAIIQEAQRIIDTNTKRRELMEKSYNHDPERAVYKNTVREIKDRLIQTEEAKKECQLAESNYDACLEEIRSQLSVI